VNSCRFKWEDEHHKLGVLSFSAIRMRKKSAVHARPSRPMRWVKTTGSKELLRPPACQFKLDRLRATAGTNFFVPQFFLRTLRQLLQMPQMAATMASSPEFLCEMCK